MDHQCAVTFYKSFTVQISRCCGGVPGKSGLTESYVVVGVTRVLILVWYSHPASSQWSYCTSQSACVQKMHLHSTTCWSQNGTALVNQWDDWNSIELVCSYACERAHTNVWHMWASVDASPASLCFFILIGWTFFLTYEYSWTLILHSVYWCKAQDWIFRHH